MCLPEGKYLFFTRPIPGQDMDIYWVSVNVITPSATNVAAVPVRLDSARGAKFFRTFSAAETFSY